MFHYFFVKSRMTGLVMDIQGESMDPGAQIIMYEKKDHSMDSMNQLFYVNPQHNVICSALNDLCLTINPDNRLCLETYSGSVSQHWQVDGDKIRNRHDNEVVDIVGESTESGAELCKWEDHNGNNQQFDVEYIEGPTPAALANYTQTAHQGGGTPPGTPSPASSSSSSSSSSSEDEKEEEESEPKYFFIRSAMHGKVLDIEGSDASAGANVIVWPQNDGTTDNQLWFMTGNRVVRSKLNGFALDCCDGDMKLHPYNPQSPTQGFRLDGEHLASMYDGRCVDISNENPDDGAKMCAWDRHDGANQRWNVDNV